MATGACVQNSLTQYRWQQNFIVLQHNAKSTESLAIGNALCLATASTKVCNCKSWANHAKVNKDSAGR